MPWLRDLTAYDNRQLLKTIDADFCCYRWMLGPAGHVNES